MTTGGSGSRRRGLSRIASLALAAILAGNGSVAQSSASVPAVGWHVFRDSVLGFSFAYPAGWVTTVGCHGSRSCISISDGKQGADDYALALEVFAGGLEQTAIDKTVFRPGLGGWVAKGRSSDHPVERVEGDGWRGLQAVVDCGISNRGIMHDGECLWTVLSDGRMSVVADTQGSSLITADIRRVIRSVHFVRE